MKVQWNNCFLCLNDLATRRDNDETTLKKGRNVRKSVGTECNKSNRASAVLLLNYLLYTKCKKYSGLIDNVVELIKHEETTENSKETSSSVRFCDECEAHLKTVSELHQQLEVVQMKLVHVLKSLQSTVVWNSKSSNGEKNGEGIRGVGLDIFEDWLTEQERAPLEDGESQLKQQRKILDTLYLFQEAVIENVQSSIVVPMVFLDKFTEFKPHITVNSSEINIKTEALDADENLNNVPSPEEHDWFSENVDDDPPKPISNVRKRKTKKTKVASSLDVKLKNETDDEDEEYLPRKKVRSASFVARLRISANEIKKPKKIRMKKEKSEPPRKQRARILEPFRLMPHSRKQKDYKNYKPSHYWACAMCPFVTPRMYCFEHHLRSHEVLIGEDNTTSSTTPLFHCDKCENVKFSVHQHLQFHQACHDGAIFMTCDICSATCEPWMLVEHMKTHVEKVYPCPNCSYCCSTREKYIQHLKSHRNKPGVIHECDICRVTCPSRNDLLDHYDKEHQVLERLTCNADGCTKEFLDPEILQRHIDNFHTTTNVCQHCGKVFAFSQSLEHHLLLHTGEKPFSCEHCSETFSSRSTLKRHILRQHAGPYKVKCEYCEKEYAEMRNLKRHIAQVHTGSGFVCEYPQCGKIFGHITGLKRHSNAHSDERKFSCKECGMQFKFQEGLKRHLRIHFGEKKFKCQYCDKAFLRTEYLTQHVKIHTNEKGYVCEKCGAGFNQQSVLHRHKRSCQKL